MITALDQVSDFPLCWPDNKPRAAHRIDSRFKSASLAVAHRLIDDEMARWHARGFVLSMAPAFRRTTTDPAVALWWNMRAKDSAAPHNLRVLACDQYQLQEHNAYAIGRTLEALRMVERYGTYSLEQAVEGAKLALPAPEGSKPLAWRDILGVVPSELPKDDAIALVNARYRRIAMEKHLDQDYMVTLNAAVEQAREELGA